MFYRAATSLVLFVFLHGCSGLKAPLNTQLKYKAVGKAPEVLAVYEAWFGHPKHISVGYLSHDPKTVKKQIQEAKKIGISGFVIDWYGDREPFIDQSYALVQSLAAKQNFHVAMMYDETEADIGATDEAIADFTMFHNAYLSSNAPGRSAYLTYDGRPLIFIFPKGNHTDWTKVRQLVDTWNPAPLLIDENLPGQYAKAFDGFYAWINPGGEGWQADGSNWGKSYLSDFYGTMRDKYADKLIIGGAWAQFDDRKASWGLNRHISARCGQTFADTFNFWRHEFPSNEPIPFMMIETWNDYEEGTAIERGVQSCGTTQADGGDSHSVDLVNFSRIIHGDLSPRSSAK